MHLQQLQDENRLTIEALHREKEELTSLSTQFENGLQEENENLKAEIQAKAERIETLHKRLIPENSIVLELTPAEISVIEAFRQGLEKRFKKPVQVDRMVFDLFWRYISEQKTQIAFPFVLSTREISNIIKKNQQ